MSEWETKAHQSTCCKVNKFTVTFTSQLEHCQANTSFFPTTYHKCKENGETNVALKCQEILGNRHCSSLAVAVKSGLIKLLVNCKYECISSTINSKTFYKENMNYFQKCVLFDMMVLSETLLWQLSLSTQTLPKCRHLTWIKHMYIYEDVLHQIPHGI